MAFFVDPFSIPILFSSPPFPPWLTFYKIYYLPGTVLNALHMLNLHMLIAP